MIYFFSFQRIQFDLSLVTDSVLCNLTALSSQVPVSLSLSVWFMMKCGTVDFFLQRIFPNALFPYIDF
jgi:hypothetical protein